MSYIRNDNLVYGGYAPATKAYPIGAINSCLKGTSILTPIDHTCDNHTVIPFISQYFKTQQFNATFSAQDNTINLELSMIPGPKVNYMMISYRLPEQYASNKSDCVAYDDLPGLHIINSIELTISSIGITERMDTTTIIDRLIEHYSLEIFTKKFAPKMGGCRTLGGENQKARTYLKYSNVFSEKDKTKNLLLPEIEIEFILPFHLFMNNEKYNSHLAINSSVMAKAYFNKISTIIDHRGSDMVFNPLSGDLIFHGTALVPVERDERTFDNLPYYGKHVRPYYFTDVYTDYRTKSFKFSEDPSIALQPAITKNFKLYLYQKHWSEGRVFYGFNVEDATANYLAANIHIRYIESARDYTLHLNTGKFLNGSNQYTAGSVSIPEESFSSNRIGISYRPSNEDVYQTVYITTNVPWSQLGDLYLNLKSTKGLIPPILGFTPSIFLFESFSLRFIEYDIANIHVSALDDTTTDGNATKVVNGIFNYKKPDGPEGETYKSYSLMNIVNCQINTKKISNEMFDLVMSQEVEVPNTFSIFGSKRFVRINRRYNPYLTLDDTQKLEIESLDFDSVGHQSIGWEKHTLEHSKPIQYMSNHWSPNVYIDYDYHDVHEKKSTLGFRDFRNIYSYKFNPKFKTIPLLIDGFEVTTYAKWKSTNEYECKLTQQCLRLLRYSVPNRHSDDRSAQYLDNGTIEEVTPPIAHELTKEIINNKLIPEGFKLAPETYDEYDSKVGDNLQIINGSKRAIEDNDYESTRYKKHRYEDEMSKRSNPDNPMPKFDGYHRDPSFFNTSAQEYNSYRRRF